MIQLLIATFLSTSLSCASTTRESTVTEMNLPEINKLWDYSNPDLTRDKFEELLNEVSGRAPLDYILQVKTQIARTYSLSAKFKEAHAILDDVEPQLTDDISIAKVCYLLERGRTYNSSGEKSKATEFFVSAYNYGKEIKPYSYSVDAAHMVGISSESLEGKLEWNLKGLSEAQKSNDPNVRKWVGVFYNNMGWDLFEAKRYEEALKNFELCRDFYQEIDAKEQLNIARWSIAKTYRMLGRVEESLEIQLALLNGSNCVDESGYTYEELAELYLLKGQDSEAKIYFKKAYEILSKDVWLQKNESERLERLKKLSE